MQIIVNNNLVEMIARKVLATPTTMRRPVSNRPLSPADVRWYAAHGFKLPGEQQAAKMLTRWEYVFIHKELGEIHPSDDDLYQAVFAEGEWVHITTPDEVQYLYELVLAEAK